MSALKRRQLSARLGEHITPHRALGLVLVTFVLLAGAVQSLTPPWEANDEPDHVRNIETLAGGHWYRIRPNSGFESHQAPLYYLLLAAYQRAMRLPVELPDGQLGPIVDNQFHGNYVHTIPQDGIDQRRLDLLRLPSILFGLLTICFTYLATKYISRDRWTPVVAAAVVAGVPRFVFLSGVVNNDNLSNVLGAAGLALGAGLLRCAPSSERVRLIGAALMGMVIGALALTKVTNVMVAPGLLLAVLLVARDRRDALRLAGLTLAVALFVSGWWFVQNQVRYGDPLAAHATTAHLRASFPPLLQIAGPFERIFVQIPQGIYKSFWYTSGYNQFVWRWFWYIPFWLLAMLGLGALLLRRRISRIPRGALWVLSLMGLGALTIVWILGLQTSTEQARVAFVGLPAIAILVALGYEKLRLPLALRFLLPTIGVVGTIAAIRYNIVIPYS